MVTTLSILLPLTVLAVCAALVITFVRDEADEEVSPPDPPGAHPEPPDPPARVPDPTPPGAAGQPVDSDLRRQQALDAMRQRYQAGPFVKLLGMQPSEQAQGGVMSWMSRRGRTINNPWLVERGRIRPERAPSSTGGGPHLTLHPSEDPSQTVTVIPGVPHLIRLRPSHPGGDEAIAGLHVAFGTYLGHFFIPAPGEGADGEIGSIYITEPDASSVTFGIDSAVLPDGRPIPGPSPYPVTMYIAAEDQDGNISNYVTRQLQVVPVGSGDLEVTLTMSQATDLDLYVHEPNGTIIYYRDISSFSGGHLDLDANAACSGNMGVNNEHIYWPRGQAPAGTYSVRVANYMSCIGGAQVDYQVTVRNCGEVAVFAGSFTGQGRREPCTYSPANDAAWCHDVVRFVVTPCP